MEASRGGRAAAVISLIALTFAMAIWRPSTAFAQRATPGRTPSAGPRSEGPGSGIHGTPRTGSTARSVRSGRNGTAVPGRDLPRGFFRASWWWFSYAGLSPAFEPANRVQDSDDAPTPSPRASVPLESSLIQPLSTLAAPQRAPQAPQGNVVLEIGPNTAQVYVDGFYAGGADRLAAGLSLDAGWHRLEFRSPGYETSAVNITVEANRTLNYRGELKPIAR